ncbi:hypothetical protein C8Q76DRAFT_694220 [Earliella scabrosa]|nr:hypothetical protein C8Q76DRAFT_694220 [Earliella scabrosa]
MTDAPVPVVSKSEAIRVIRVKKDELLRRQFMLDSKLSRHLGSIATLSAQLWQQRFLSTCEVENAEYRQVREKSLRNAITEQFADLEELTDQDSFARLLEPFNVVFPIDDVSASIYELTERLLGLIQRRKAVVEEAWTTYCKAASTWEDVVTERERDDVVRELQRLNACLCDQKADQEDLICSIENLRTGLVHHPSSLHTDAENRTVDVDSLLGVYDTLVDLELLLVVRQNIGEFSRLRERMYRAADESDPSQSGSLSGRMESSACPALLNKEECTTPTGIKLGVRSPLLAPIPASRFPHADAMPPSSIPAHTSSTHSAFHELCDINRMILETKVNLDAALYEHLSIRSSDDIEIWKHEYLTALRDSNATYRSSALGRLRANAWRARTNHAAESLSESLGDILKLSDSIHGEANKVMLVYEQAIPEVNESQRAFLIAEIQWICSTVRMIEEAKQNAVQGFERIKIPLQILGLPEDQLDAILNPLLEPPFAISSNSHVESICHELYSLYEERNDTAKQSRDAVESAFATWFNPNKIVHESDRDVIVASLQQLRDKVCHQVAKQNELLTSISLFKERVEHAPSVLITHTGHRVDIVELLTAMRNYGRVMQEITHIYDSEVGVTHYHRQLEAMLLHKAVGSVDVAAFLMFNVTKDPISEP